MTIENKNLCHSPQCPQSVAQLVVDGYQGLRFRRNIWRLVNEHLLLPAIRLHHYKNARTGMWRGAQRMVECCRRTGATTNSNEMDQA